MEGLFFIAVHRTAGGTPALQPSLRDFVGQPNKKGPACAGPARSSKNSYAYLPPGETSRFASMRFWTSSANGPSSAGSSFCCSVAD
jgi:hypothetical protein